MEKEKIDTLKAVSDRLLEKAIDFEIIILPQNWLHRWLQQKGVLPSKKYMVLRPLVMGTLIRISKLLLTIDAATLKGTNYLDTSHRLVTAYGETVVHILAVAIQNTKSGPTEKMLSLIRNNLTSAEMMQLLSLVLQQMDLTSFISSIISMRGLNVLESEERKRDESEVSPMSQGR